MVCADNGPGGVSRRFRSVHLAVGCVLLEANGLVNGWLCIGGAQGAGMIPGEYTLWLSLAAVKEELIYSPTTIHFFASPFFLPTFSTSSFQLDVQV